MREEEKSIQDFEALHSSLISLDKSDEEQDTVSCLESRGGVHNLPRFALGPQRKIIEPAGEAVCKQEGWSSQQHNP